MVNVFIKICNTGRGAAASSATVESSGLVGQCLQGYLLACRGAAASTALLDTARTVSAHPVVVVVVSSSSSSRSSGTPNARIEGLVDARVQRLLAAVHGGGPLVELHLAAAQRVALPPRLRPLLLRPRLVPTHRRFVARPSRFRSRKRHWRGPRSTTSTRSVSARQAGRRVPRQYIRSDVQCPVRACSSV